VVEKEVHTHVYVCIKKSKRSMSSFSQTFSHLDRAVANEKRQRQHNQSSSSKNKRMKVVVPISSSVIVNRCQKGNPVLRYITNVPWTFQDKILPDYIMGEGACGLFISLRYYLLHPNYLYTRVRELKNQYKVRVLLCLVDLVDNERAILEITKISIFHECTLILAWSSQEIARYIETYKAYEKKSATSIQEKTSTEYIDKLTDCMHQIRSVNKRDVVNLASVFGSLSEIMQATKEELLMCPGIGATKAKRIYDAFHVPFVVDKTKKST
jgi:DNA excision repair protein ERCC-1